MMVGAGEEKLWGEVGPERGGRTFLEIKCDWFASPFVLSPQSTDRVGTQLLNGRTPGVRAASSLNDIHIEHRPSIKIMIQTPIW